jgi:hypothetical protein
LREGILGAPRLGDAESAALQELRISITCLRIVFHEQHEWGLLHAVLLFA